MHNEMRFEWFRGDSLTRYAPHARILVPIFDKCWGNEVRSLKYTKNSFQWFLGRGCTVFRMLCLTERTGQCLERNPAGSVIRLLSPPNLELGNV